MCGRSNEAVLWAASAFFNTFSADTLHIPSVISFADAAAQVFYINYYASLRIHSLRNEHYWNTIYGYPKRSV